jgi:2-keto-3-deoxy-L-rhamnonate aldolase RhmA
MSSVLCGPKQSKLLLTTGRRLFNVCYSIPSSYVAEAPGHQGFDTVIIDLQHGANGTWRFDDDADFL